MRALWIVAWLLAAIAPASAQFSMMVQGPASGPSFTGYVDEEPTIRNCWAVKACGSAAASANAAAVTITNNAGTTCTGIKLLSTGTLDISSGTSYCTGSVTVTSACSTNCVTSGTFRITQLYDQVGSSNRTSTYTHAPDFILSGFNGKPAMGFRSANSDQMSGTITALALTNGYSVGLTFEQNANFGTFQGYGFPGGTNPMYPAHNSVNTVEGLYGGTSSTIAATDGSGTTDFSHCHAIVLTVASTGTSGTIFVDGANTAISTGGVTASSTTMYIGSGGGANFSDIFSTAFWLDANALSTGTGNAVTSLTNVPCGQ